MIDCLNNYIGVRGLAPYEDPDSGYYINDLQGITTEQLEEISDDEDHYEVRLAWDDIYARASRLLETDIKTSLKKYFKRYSYIDNGITGQLTKSETLTSASNYNGWSFDLGYQSKNLVLNISDFSLFLNTSNDFDIFIYDLNTGQKLDEIRYTGVEGLSTYRINKNYAVHKYSNIFVCYDASEISVLKMTEYKPLGFTQSGSIAKSGSVLDANLTNGDTGLNVVFNLECSVSNFVCQRIDNFKDAFLYKLGIEFCNERIYSDRINRYTLMDREDAVSLRDEFKLEYDQLIEAALKDLKVTESDECFECNKSVNYKVMLP
ncbi:MAG: hypothetical protein JXQ96_23345 [Cyclobacteriaceae bacterium]